MSLSTQISSAGSACERLQAAGEAELSVQFEAYLPQLRRMIDYRLPPVLQGRVDPEDILQDAWLEAARRLPDYLNAPEVPVYIWLRQIVRHALSLTFRFHVTTARRSVTAEAGRPLSTGVSTDSIVGALGDSGTSPSTHAARTELQASLRQHVENMPPLEREVLTLRQMEGLTFAEVAAELQISVPQAKRAFTRAALQLRSVLQDHCSHI